MSRPRIGSVDHVPHIRAQRTIQSVWPKDASGYHDATPTPQAEERPGRYLPGQLGRFPTIGLDPGCPRWAKPGANLE